MNFKKTFKRLAIVIIALLTIQTSTYIFFAEEQLKGKLLTGHFGELRHSSDSAFVRDFYVSDCISGSFDKYLSHDLKGIEMKQKKN